MLQVVVITINWLTIKYYDKNVNVEYLGNSLGKCQNSGSTTSNQGRRTSMFKQGWNILEQFYPRDHPVLPKATIEAGLPDNNLYH